MSASDKWPGFVLTKEGEEFVQTNANYFKYDLCYNPMRFESWLKLAKILDEVRDLKEFNQMKHPHLALAAFHNFGIRTTLFPALTYATEALSILILVLVLFRKLICS